MPARIACSPFAEAVPAPAIFAKPLILVVLTIPCAAFTKPVLSLHQHPLSALLDYQQAAAPLH